LRLGVGVEDKRAGADHIVAQPGLGQIAVLLVLLDRPRGDDVGGVHSRKRRENAVGWRAQLQHHGHIVWGLDGGDVRQGKGDSLFHPDLTLDRQFYRRRIKRRAVREADPRPNLEGVRETIRRDLVTLGKVRDDLEGIVLVLDQPLIDRAPQEW
jgi:hypothetical protein